LGLVVTTFVIVSLRLLPWKGVFPSNKMYIIIPRDQTSTEVI
jgi:hypothetical protein